MARILAFLVLIGSICVPDVGAVETAPLPDSYPAPFADERIAERWLTPDVRAIVNIPGRSGTTRPKRLVVYATPNGSTIEQTLGFARSADGKADIQHILAQVRRHRFDHPHESIGLACIEPEGLSWPAWRKKHAEAAPRLALQVVGAVRELSGAPQAELVLTGHSGGGAFTWAVLDSGDAVPDGIGHFAWLDSNYSYSDESRHGDKLLGWLRGGADRRVSILAYDDRRITLDGKAVIGPDGGTYRATARMLERFGREVDLTAGQSGPFATRSGLDGRLRSWVHDNPDNRILHTALVGEMNALRAVLDPTQSPAPPRGYSRFVEPAPNIPDRPPGAAGGAAFLGSIAGLSRGGREDAIATEILRGNIPEFLRRFATVEVRGVDTRGTARRIELDVMPDYLAIGSDSDWVRVPMEPATAQRIAAAFGCTLPTRKMVDDIWRAAVVRLKPLPLTRDRESVATFLEHHRQTEEQRAGGPEGGLCVGAKKDIVVTNRLSEKPNRVAIYGWHQPDGRPIQPLSIAHVNRYVDYSHGVRLVRRQVRVDGRPRDIRHVLQSPELHGLLADEGPLLRPSY